MDQQVFGGVNLGIYFNGLIFSFIILVIYFSIGFFFRRPRLIAYRMLPSDILSSLAIE